MWDNHLKFLENNTECEDIINVRVQTTEMNVLLCPLEHSIASRKEQRFGFRKVK